MLFVVSVTVTISRVHQILSVSVVLSLTRDERSHSCDIIIIAVQAWAHQSHLCIIPGVTPTLIMIELLLYKLVHSVLLAATHLMRNYIISMLLSTIRAHSTMLDNAATAFCSTLILCGATPYTVAYVIAHNWSMSACCS